MKHRLLALVTVFMIIAIMWTGCKTITDLTKGSEERNLLQLKRGTLNEAGLYQNSYYEFEVKMPEGWRGTIDDPPVVLAVNPSALDIADSSARKFIRIKTNVTKHYPDQTLEQSIDRYIAGKQYERILERPSTVLGAESQKVLFYSKSQAKEMKIVALFVLRGDHLIVIECHALRPLFDNVEAQFGACLDSFRITGKVKPDDTTDSSLFRLVSGEDFVIYIVSTDDQIEELAMDFLGTADRAWLIKSTNEIEKITAGDRIKIPCFIAYDVKAGDSYPLISQKILNSTKYVSAIRAYNENIDLQVGSKINVPLYITQTPVVGETYTDIALSQYKSSKLAERLLQYNNMQPIESLEYVKLPIFFQEQYYFYKVQPSDTLAWISRWLTGDAKNYRSIAEVNSISYPYRLTVGLQLKIPASLVSDPTVFDKPIPRAKKPGRKPTPVPAKKDEAAPKKEPPKPTATPEAKPLDDPGLFDID